MEDIFNKFDKAHIWLNIIFNLSFMNNNDQRNPSKRLESKLQNEKVFQKTRMKS